MQQGGDMMMCLLLMSATEFLKLHKMLKTPQDTEIFTHYSLDTFQLITFMIKWWVKEYLKKTLLEIEELFGCKRVYSFITQIGGWSY